MKYIIIAFLIFITILSTDSQSQTISTNLIKNSENQLFKNYPNPFNKITQIEFNIKDDSFVKLIITDLDDNNIETLVEGEIGKGIHVVFFKEGENSKKIKYKCKLEIYSEDISRKIFSDEITMDSQMKESGGIK